MFLVKIKEELKYEGDILDYITSNGFSVSELTFTSQQIKNDLARYNMQKVVMESHLIQAVKSPVPPVTNIYFVISISSLTRTPLLKGVCL